MRTTKGLVAILLVASSRVDAGLLCRDLERAVEDLSELLESPIEPENIPSLRQKVTDKTVNLQPDFIHFS